MDFEKSIHMWGYTEYAADATDAANAEYATNTEYK